MSKDSMTAEQLQALADFANDPENRALLEDGGDEPCPEDEVVTAPVNHVAGDFSDLDTHGCVNLVTGIVERAIEDYRALESAGILKNGKIVGKFGKRQTVVDIGNISEAAQLVHWLEGDELEDFLNLACLNINADCIRSGLGLTS